MIRKQDILNRATEWQLRPDVVEKDYVLGWLLAGLARHPIAGQLWIFKGGTSIKKCYVETYRFSEDIDVSLLPDAPYTESAIRETLRDLAQTAHELSGIEFPEDQIEVRSRNDKLGRPTFQGRIAYRGPLGTPYFPRVLFDITQHEPILDEPVARSVFHPYPDAPQNRESVRAYSFNEILAEKTRALYERTRPRDLYDVVYLLENEPEAFSFSFARDLFGKKCDAKSLEVPSKDTLLRTIEQAEELRTEWENMLAHQLPNLPKLDDMLRRLPDLLQWIDEPTVILPEMTLAAPPISEETVSVAPAGIQYWGTGQPLEVIRFAGSNRLLVEFDYHGIHRFVEPYSLRRASTGNLLLYGWERGETHIKAFNVAKILNIRSTDISFAPRYRVEFAPH
jgi:predicted nucleotidyltransferase component of viral defense system